MAVRTDKQALLEQLHGKPLDRVLRETLESYRGQRQQVTLTGLALGVTGVTVYSWCNDLGIDIEEYRRPLQGRGQDLAEGKSEGEKRGKE